MNLYFHGMLYKYLVKKSEEFENMGLKFKFQQNLNWTNWMQNVGEHA